MFLLLTSAQFGGHSGSLFQRHAYNRCSVIKLYSVSARQAKSKEKKTYYEVLGLSDKCTRTEIKHAYYRLSKLFHPDVNKTELAHVRFQHITEAYEVLGNVHKRRLYDKGLYNPQHPDSTVHPSREPDLSPEAFTHRKYSPRRPPPTGRSKIYNFDEFYRQHYGQTLKRDQEYLYYLRKARKEQGAQQAQYEQQHHWIKKNSDENSSSLPYYAAGVVFSGVFFVCWWLLN